VLGFVEEIVLLQIDEKGKLVELSRSAAEVVLAGAALMELALRNICGPRVIAVRSRKHR